MTTVLFVGDSITCGVVGYPSKTDGSSFRRKAASSMGWTAVGPHLVPCSPDPNGLLHGGVGGATTQTFVSGAAQWVQAPSDDATWMRQFKPDIVICMLGVNDIISSFPIPGIIDRMAQLFNSAAALHPQAKLYAASVVEAGPASFTLAAHAYNGGLRAHANHSTPTSKFPGQSQFIEACALYNAAFYSEGTTKNLTVDGTHPNQRGYDLIAQGIVNSLAQKPGLSTGARVFAAGVAVYAGYKLSRLFS